MIEVKSFVRPDRDSTSLYIIKKDPTCRHFEVAKSMKLEWVKFEEGSVYPNSTLELPRNLGPELLQAFARAASLKGIGVEQESKLAGMLEAQTRHLEDLRGILKMKKVLK